MVRRINRRSAGVDCGFDRGGRPNNLRRGQGIQRRTPPADTRVPHSLDGNSLSKDSFTARFAASEAQSGLPIHPQMRLPRDTLIPEAAKLLLRRSLPGTDMRPPAMGSEVCRSDQSADRSWDSGGGRLIGSRHAQLFHPDFQAAQQRLQRTPVLLARRHPSEIPHRGHMGFARGSQQPAPNLGVCTRLRGIERRMSRGQFGECKLDSLGLCGQLT